MEVEPYRGKDSTTQICSRVSNQKSQQTNPLELNLEDLRVVSSKSINASATAEGGAPTQVATPPPRSPRSPPPLPPQLPVQQKPVQESHASVRSPSPSQPPPNHQSSQHQLQPKLPIGLSRRLFTCRNSVEQVVAQRKQQQHQTNDSLEKKPRGGGPTIANMTDHFKGLALHTSQLQSPTRVDALEATTALGQSRRFRDRIRLARGGLETERSDRQELLQERLEPARPSTKQKKKKKRCLLPNLESTWTSTCANTNQKENDALNLPTANHTTAATSGASSSDSRFRSKMLHRRQIVAFRDQTGAITKESGTVTSKATVNNDNVVVVKARLGKTEALWIEKQMQFAQRINLLDRECRGFLHTFRNVSSFGAASAELVEMIHSQVARCERDRADESKGIQSELQSLKTKARQLEMFVSQLSRGKCVVTDLEELLKSFEDAMESFRVAQRERYDKLVVEEKLLDRELSAFIIKVNAWDEEDAQERRQRQLLVQKQVRNLGQQQQPKELERRAADDKQDNQMIRRVRRIDQLIERSGGLLGGWDAREHGMFLRLLRRNGLSDRMILKHYLIASRYAMQRADDWRVDGAEGATEENLFENQSQDDQGNEDPPADETVEEFLSEVVDGRGKAMHTDGEDAEQDQMPLQEPSPHDDDSDQSGSGSRGSPVEDGFDLNETGRDRYESLVARFLTSCMDQIVTQTPNGIRQHFQWYGPYLALVDEKKRVINKWRKEKDALRQTFTQKGLAFGDDGSLMTGADPAIGEGDGDHAQAQALQQQKHREEVEQKLAEWRKTKQEKEEQQQLEQQLKAEEDAQKQAARKQRFLETKQKVLLYKLSKEEASRQQHLRQLQNQPQKPSPKINQLIRERSQKALEEARLQRARRLEMEQLASEKSSWQVSSFSKKKTNKLAAQRSPDNLFKPTKASAARRLTKTLLVQQEQERILQSAHDSYFPGMEAGREVKLKSFGHVPIQPRATPLWRRNL